MLDIDFTNLLMHTDHTIIITMVLIHNVRWLSKCRPLYNVHRELNIYTPEVNVTTEVDRMYLAKVYLGVFYPFTGITSDMGHRGKIT